MKNFILGAALATSVFCGCRVIDESHNYTADQLQARMLGEKFARSFAEADSQTFMDCLSAELRYSMNEEKFATSYQQIIEKFGNVESCEFLSELENPIYEIQLWKMSFEKDRTVNDMVFRVLMAEDSGKMQVVSFAFL